MTDIQIVAFVVAPLMAVAVGFGVTLWSRYADR
ncbi:hypothetical protein AFCDBAGC_3407 [Methylobacterium cerastii]|uniref:Uncharacterized protein n=1 Tax=Methylobacterium cerastii TaxID=932741 RepID=A0ABQ4QJV5_9HYPH|nr:hypothetical protein AFCDBAGC_3407 [Methylobacterium cerastii]